MATKLVVAMCVVAAAMAGCVAAPQTAPSDNRVLLSGTSERVVGETVYGANFGPFARLNDDCSVRAFARVRILEQPRNGRAVVVLEDGVASFSANNAFARCNGSPLRAPIVSYTPREGFTGIDRFRFEIIFPNGERRVLSPELTVKPRP
jgi:hypothetical protein